MKEAKPILLIKVDRDIDIGPGGLWGDNGLQKSMQEMFFDYHVLCIPSDLDDPIELQVFNDANATETSIEELKQFIISEMKSEWQPISTAPKTGTVIEVSYGDGSNHSDNCLAFWSENPVCMAGSINGSYPPGWATAGDSTDKNLPIDTPEMWREIKDKL